MLLCPSLCLLPVTFIFFPRILSQWLKSLGVVSFFSLLVFVCKDFPPPRAARAAGSFLFYK